MTFVRRFAAPALVVILIAELLARVWSGATNPVQVSWYDAPVQLRVDALEEGEDPEVIFVGTSMAWQGFVPERFTAADPSERSAYNLGIDGGIPQVIEPWLLDEVLPRTDPALVVWGLSSLDLSTTFGESPFERYSSALATRPGIVGEVDRAVSSVSAMVEWRRVLRDPALWQSSADRDDLSTAASEMGLGGERRDWSPAKTEERRDILRSRLAGDEADQLDAAAFSRTVEALSSQGVETVVVLMPVPPTFMDAHPGGRDDFARRRDALERMALDNGARVLDFTAEFGEAAFVDFTHLNESSAAEFTELFANSLNQEATTAAVENCTTELVEDAFGFLVEEEVC